MNRKKKVGIGCLGLIGILFIAVGALWYFNPFAPHLHMTDPEPDGRRITENGLLGNYYPAKGKSKAPAILLLGGSNGGLDQHMSHMSQALQEQGFTVLQLSYWRAPGQSESLKEIPIEYFEKGISWLTQQPEVDAENLAIAGWSRGSEIAALVALNNPELDAVILGMPTSSIWPSFSWDTPWNNGDSSAWSIDGKPTEYLKSMDGLSHGQEPEKLKKETIAVLEKYPEAEIEFAQIQGAVLLVCGRKDRIWPSCPMAELAKFRANEGGKDDVVLFESPDAGHFAYGAPYEGDIEFLDGGEFFGGTAKANNDALKQGFAEIVRFLNEEFKTEEDESLPTG